MRTKFYYISFLIILKNIFFAEAQNQGKDFIAYLQNNRQTPNQYVIEKFANHDIVFIGEFHFLKQQVEFIKQLIPEMYKNGIYNLGTEFLKYSQTQEINEIITDSVFNEKKVRELYFYALWHWGYQEYIDIIKEAWLLNKSLPKQARKFKIFGINEDRDFSFIQDEKDFDNPQIMQKVHVSGSKFKESEGYYAYAIEQEVINKREKAIIHCGFHHAFTSYFQPHYDYNKHNFAGGYEKERCGNLIKKKMKEKAITVFLNGPWYKNGYNELCLPFDGVLDSLFQINENRQYLPFGVDTKNTPFGNLTGFNSTYKFGYENFSAKDFCDGIVFLCPTSEYDIVIAIPDFISENMVEYVKQQEFEYRNKNISAGELNELITKQTEEYQKLIKSLK